MSLFNLRPSLLFYEQRCSHLFSHVNIRYYDCYTDTQLFVKFSYKVHLEELMASMTLTQSNFKSKLFKPSCFANTPKRTPQASAAFVEIGHAVHSEATPNTFILQSLQIAAAPNSILLSIIAAFVLILYHQD